MIRQSVEDLKSSMYPNPAPQKVLVWHLWWQTIGKNQTKREKKIKEMIIKIEWDPL